MSNLFKTSPMFDTIEIVSDRCPDSADGNHGGSAYFKEDAPCLACGQRQQDLTIHEHRCHICHEPFTCIRPDCHFEDRYAVCFKPECIEEFEKPEVTE